MKAVIMAGGNGTRLRPLTCDMPKPMVPLCGRPVLEYILELLGKHGVENAILTLLYLGEQIEQYFEDDSFAGVSLTYSYETTPLGTAGSVKQAVGSGQEDVLVISGDAMCDFDLSKAIAFHKAKQADATLIVKQVEDPREYGLVSCGKEGRIEAFLEKPSYADCTTDLANTGIYLLSPKVFDLIPEGENCDFAQDVFPKMLEQQQNLYCYKDDGYWCDIGDFDSYIDCQRDMMEGRVSCDLHAEQKNGIWCRGNYPQGEFTCEGPVFLGANITIGKYARLMPGSVVCDNAVIHDGTKVNGSIILPHAVIGNQATLNRAVICENASVMQEAGIYEDCVVGAGATVKRGASLLPGVKVWNRKVVDSNTVLSEDLQYGNGERVVFDDEGICGETNTVISPELCARLGSATASLQENCTIGIACNGNVNAALALKQAVASGITAAGCNVWDFGECVKSQFDFCLCKSLVEFGIYLDGGVMTTVTVCQKGGMPLLRSLERKLEAGINRNEFKKVSYRDFGVQMQLDSFTEMYRIELLKMAEKSLDDMSVYVKTTDDTVKSILNKVLEQLGADICETSDCVLSGGIVLQISRDGKSIAAFTQETGYVFHEKILALLCLELFQKGEDIALENSAPSIIDQFAQVCKRKVYRYSESPCNGKDAAARQKAVGQFFLRDGMMMGIKLLSFLKKHRLSLKEAMEAVPDFTMMSRFVSIDKSPSRIVRMVSEQASETEKQGNVRIRPVKSGKGIMVFAEAMKSETAQEICDFYEDLIKKSRDSE